MAKTAVIGAGVMGLACAYELLKRGHSVDIYEADDRVGGMAAHFDFKGLNIERYYHFICKPDHYLFDLLNELGIEDKLQWRETYMGYYYDGQMYDWGNPIALFKFPKLGFIAKFRYGLHAFLSTKRKNWLPLDDVEASDWIRKWIGEEAYNILWKRLFALKFFNYKDDLSAAWIWSRIKRVGSSRKSMLQEELGYLEGGSETLLHALEQKIIALGGKIHLSTKVEKVNIQNNQVQSITLAGHEEKFDRIFSTVPLPYVSRMVPDLPADYRARYESIQNMGVVCVIFRLRKGVSRNFWLNVSDESMEIPGIIEFSNLRPLQESVVYVPYYMPRDYPKFANDNDFFIAEAKQYIKQLNPEITEEDFIAVHASRYGYAQPVCQPGFSKVLPPITTAINGLYIADTSYYYPEDRSISESVNVGKKMAELANKQ
jgi:protoporphyrinogen oxidase